jgi:hypothetical protein
MFIANFNYVFDGINKYNLFSIWSAFYDRLIGKTTTSGESDWELRYRVNNEKYHVNTTLTNLIN